MGTCVKTVPSPGLAVNGSRETGGFLFFSESYGGMFVCQGEVQQLGKAGDAEARRVPVMRSPFPAPSGVQHIQSLCNEQRLSGSFSNWINSAFPGGGGGRGGREGRGREGSVTTEEAGEASALSLVPQPLTSACVGYLPSCCMVYMPTGMGVASLPAGFQTPCWWHVSMGCVLEPSANFLCAPSLWGS